MNVMHGHKHWLDRLAGGIKRAQLPRRRVAGRALILEQSRRRPGKGCACTPEVGLVSMQKVILRLVNSKYRDRIHRSLACNTALESISPSFLVFRNCNPQPA
ncbi:hypothetical protein N7465_005770 [Penicillium sp. CMV-2018d]|nr:hypothetical protein N7465_005770 [Penicillium sp. CMV-2018d]